MAKKGEAVPQNKDSKDNKEQAATLPLFYKDPAPLDAKRHAKLSLKKDFGFGFAKEVNAVPVNLIELPQVCHFYPIAFSPDAAATPVAITGLRDGENLFVHKDGSWEKHCYIPAYVRRYPFIFSEMPDSDQLTLCVDMDKNVVEENGEQPFFDAEGQPSALAKNALEFCKSYHAAAQKTLEFSKLLLSHDLLVEREAQINVPGNKRINFSGFKIIDEKKLESLGDKEFLELRKSGFLPFIYAHLFSGAQWQRLSFMIGERLNN